MKESSNSKAYEDILGLPHHVSDYHPHMPLLDRAAQFSPFSALTGYEEAVQEEGRLTSGRVELAEDEKTLLDEKLQTLLAKDKDTGDTIFTCFRPDERKEGGSYITLRGHIRKLDQQGRTIALEDGRHVPIEEIVNIRNDYI